LVLTSFAGAYLAFGPIWPFGISYAHFPERECAWPYGLSFGTQSHRLLFVCMLVCTNVILCRYSVGLLALLQL